jgi:hypothetical protein
MEVEYRPGAGILAGSFPVAGICLIITDPWGNASTVVSGSKPEHGEGGFEALTPHAGTYSLTFCAEVHEVETRGDTTIVTFTKAQPPAPDPDEDAILEQILERLIRIVDLLQQHLDSGDGS